MSSERTHVYAEPEPDVCERLGVAFEQLGSTWRLKVLNALHEADELRFSELETETGASSRTLARVLDDLQEADLVDRRLEEDAPIATYYSHTPKAEALCPLFSAVDEWAAEWIDPDED